MAINKTKYMKASGKGRVDIHLEHFIKYILQPKKLGNYNLTGGINCLSDSAYEQMKATKQMFGKAGGRQGYHFVISLKPDEGTPEIMYDIATRFAEEAFGGEYETVVAVHTDRNHLHAHIIINSVNMVTGYKFQYHEGDWKYKFQPITNRLCEEYGQYGDASLAFPVNHAMSLIPIRKTILTPYQRKCYARMYRLRLAEKERFTYKSAYLYEQIRKMHELQEEYLVVVKYDVKSFVDLVHLKFHLQQMDGELCKVQKKCTETGLHRKGHARRQKVWHFLNFRRRIIGNGWSR